MVAALHHVLRLHHVLAPAPVPVGLGQPPGLVQGQQVGVRGASKRRVLPSAGVVGPVQIEEDILKTKRGYVSLVELIQQRSEVVMSVWD